MKVREHMKYEGLEYTLRMERGYKRRSNYAKIRLR
jgi:hypothetical protein